MNETMLPRNQESLVMTIKIVIGPLREYYLLDANQIYSLQLHGMVSDMIRYRHAASMHSLVNLTPELSKRLDDESKKRNIFISFIKVYWPNIEFQTWRDLNGWH